MSHFVRTAPVSQLLLAAAVTLGLWLCATGEAQAEEVASWDTPTTDGIDLQPVSLGTYRSIEVAVANTSSSTKTVTFPYGAFFNAESDRYQDLAVVFPDQVTVGPGEVKTINVKTTCMHAGRGVAGVGYVAWTPDRDAALGDVLRFYDLNRPSIEAATGPENHDTVEKRHNFLQLLVWTYYRADKKHMKRFAKQYMFDGDEAAADEFIETFYPLAKMAIDLYKAANAGGLPF